MFSIITNYKKMFFSFIRNEFAGGETPGGGEAEPLNNKPLDNNSFDGGAVSDFNVLKGMLSDNKVSTKEKTVIRISINNIHIDAQADLKNFVAELNPEKKVVGKKLLYIIASEKTDKLLMNIIENIENIENREEGIEELKKIEKLIINTLQKTEEGKILIEEGKILTEELAEVQTVVEKLLEAKVVGKELLIAKEKLAIIQEKQYNLEEKTIGLLEKTEEGKVLLDELEPILEKLIAILQKTEEGKTLIEEWKKDY